MKSIFWLTGSSFFDVDIDIVPFLSKKYDIFWVVLKQQESFYSAKEMAEVMQINGIKGKVIELPGRLRSLGSFLKFKEAVSLMSKMNADCYYINYLGIPYLFPLIKLSRIKNNLVIYPCHDFIDHLHIKKRGIIGKYKKFNFNNFRHFHFFSETQMNAFRAKYKTKNTYFAPLCLKDFGESSLTPPDDKVIFTFFGTVRRNKGLELLIKAAEEVYKDYPNSFEVKIYGNCNNWEDYDCFIKNRDIFSLNIRRIENSEIADLYCKSHYLVLPYLDVTQSGPMLISYNYKVPIIASDHDGFKEFVEHEETGYLFENENYMNLASVMKECIRRKKEYHTVKEKLSNYVDSNLCIEKISELYIQMFEAIS